MEPEAEGGLHVLLVTHYFAEQGGGIERVAAQLATHLVRTGHRVTWAASDTCPLTESPSAATQCVPMRAWDGIQRATGAPWPIWSLTSIWRLWSLVGKASVVHLHDCLYMGNAFAYLFARLRGRPVVVTQHVSDVPFKSPLLKIALWLAYQSVGRLILGHADQVVFISEVVRNDFQSRFRFHNEPRFVPNGVDSSLFVPLNGERREKLRGELLGTFGTKTVFMFAGRFVEKKGLSALRRIAASMPDRFFVLVGQGPIDPQTWGLENVQVVGAVTQCELARYYQAADALVLPSVGEGLPLVVQEAMSAGLPAAVSSRTARADSTVSACLLHAPCTDELDEDAVVDRWIALLDSFDRETSSSEARRNEIRQVATSRWAWERCAEQYAEIFRALCR
jgi:glycosyltransferase involved in cell wall biosynthesis